MLIVTFVGSHQRSKVKLWIDDERDPPRGEGWLIARTADQAALIIKTHDVVEISFDHDLGDESDTGYHLINWIEREIYFGRIKLPTMRVHSMNPVGRRNILRAISAIEERAA